MDPATAEAQAEALAARQAEERAAAERAALAQQPAGEQAGVQAGGAQVEAAEPVQVVLIWEGIGPLHKGFFSDAQATTGLSVGLAGSVSAPANVYVRYDSATFAGSLRLQLRPDTLRLSVRHQGDVVALGDLAPITRALAAYRSDVAGRYDVRVESFAVGIESFRGADGCVFGVAGAPPPDGSVVSPCVVVGGQQRCGQPEAEGVRFPPEVARAVKACLDLR
ncbi:hypothetical protein L6R53_22855 [Myxococcota bacterium]|nr:hypothetical protein [Myxococcota bacterium]